MANKFMSALSLIPKDFPWLHEKNLAIKSDQLY